MKIGSMSGYDSEYAARCAGETSGAAKAPPYGPGTMVNVPVAPLAQYVPRVMFNPGGVRFGGKPIATGDNDGSLAVSEKPPSSKNPGPVIGLPSTSDVASATTTQFPGD